MIEIMDRSAFTQELGVYCDAEVSACVFAGEKFKRRNDGLFDCSREHRAAHRDDVEAALLCKRFADLLAGAFDVAQVETAVVISGRADAGQRDIRVGDW